MLNKKKIKSIIENFEYRHSGMKHINGGYALAKNVRVRKDIVIADVIIGNDMDGTQCRYNNCEYSKDMFKGDADAE